MVRYVVGIDEVGRGALAGPVAVAAVAMPFDLRPKTKNLKLKLGRLKDSKKLTVKKREEWSKFLCSHPRLDYTIARVYPRQIEKKNISAAANLAAKRAYARLVANSKWPIMAGRRVFLDGGLYLASRKWQTANCPRAKTIVRGDEKFKAVAAASIIAKVNRDRAMIRLAKQYPQYGFEAHKGYGTNEHLKAIRKYGPSKTHRLTFLS